MRQGDGQALSSTVKHCQALSSTAKQDRHLCSHAHNTLSVYAHARPTRTLFIPIQDALHQLKAAVLMLFSRHDEPDCCEKQDASSSLQSAMSTTLTLIRSPLKLRAAAVVQEVGVVVDERAEGSVH
jgi:hypothetical protein